MRPSALSRTRRGLTRGWTVCGPRDSTCAVILSVITIPICRLSEYVIEPSSLADPRLRGGHQVIDAFARHRRGEEKTLHFVTSRQAQEHALFLGLDTLHGDTQAQRPAKRDNRLNDHSGIRGMFER